MCCLLVLVVVLVPAVRLTSSYDAGDHAALKHVRSAPAGWRTAVPGARTSDALPVPTLAWWSLPAEISGSAIAAPSAPFVPPRSR